MVNELYLKLDRNASAARRMIAARVATFAVGGAVVALTFVMQYAQGADDLFNLSNKVFGVFLPPIAIPMLAGLFVRKLSRRSALVALVGGIVAGIVQFSLGAKPEFAFLREMVWIFPATALATVAFLAAGTKIFPDAPAERKEVERWTDGLTCR
jgi:Na+/proline symporter